MTIYFAGTERDAVEGGIGTTTDSTYYDATYSKLAVTVSSTLSCGFSLNSEIETGGNFWIGFCHFAPNTLGNSSNFILLNNTANQPVMSITGTGGNGTQRLTLYNDTGNSNSLDFAWSKNSLIRWDVNVYTENGTCYAKIYRNNLLFINQSLAGTTRGLKTLSLYSSGSEIYGYVSEIIIADESTLGMRVKTYRPIADGFHKTWAGNYDNVNNNDVSIDAISTSLSNAAETFLHGATLNEGTAIRALAVGAAIASSNPTAAKAILNIDGTLYQKNFVKPLAQGAPPNVAIYEVNPATGLSFTPTNFNNLEFGVQHS